MQQAAQLKRGVAAAVREDVEESSICELGSSIVWKR